MRFLLLTTLLACTLLAALPPSAAADPSWAWPVQGDVITPYRNDANPYAPGQHRGIDIAADPGARVSAAAAGTVTFAGTAGSAGLTVNVRTADGRFDTSYLHLGSAAVREGDTVAVGDRIGAVGTSGRRSAERPHLHFGVREAGNRHAYVDPLGLLPPAEPPRAPEPPPAPVPVPALPFLEHAAPAVAEAPPDAAPAPFPAPETLPGRLLTPRPALAHASPRARSPLGAPALAAQAELDSSRREAHVRAAAHSPSRTASPGQAAPGSSPRSEAAVREVSVDRPVPERTGGGLDLGWLVACLGLVAVALALGRPAGPAAAARQGRRTIAALARPLTGRG